MTRIDFVVPKSWQKFSYLAFYASIASAEFVTYIQLFRERLSEKKGMRQPPKGSMGYVQYTVPDTVAVEPTFVAFL